MKNLFKSKKGFTLVELVVVIVIIAILAAALVTSLVGYINKAKDTNALLEANNALTACQSVISEKAGTGSISTVYLPAVRTAAGTLVGTTYTSNTVKAISLDTNSTISYFDFVASNGVEYNYTVAGGWVKGTGTPIGTAMTES